MPAKSESQKRLFCMAYAVRKGKLARNKVNKAVLDIADSDMTDKEIQDFMVKESMSLMEFIREKLEEKEGYDTPYSDENIEVDFPEKERAFIVIKPGFLFLSEEILKMFKDNGFIIEKTRPKKLLEKEARKLYAVHKKEDFFEDLVKYMASDISLGVLFRPEKKMKLKNFFKKVDKLKDKVREQWSESDMRNVMHYSDNLENMKEESSVYF